MVTLNESVLRGQVSDCRDFSSNQVSSDLHDLLINPDPIHFVEGKTKSKIVCALSKSYPNKIRVVELSSMIDIHRSTVSKHCSELVASGVVIQDILSGTESRVNPTFLFTLNPEIRQEVDKLIQARSKTDPELTKINTDPDLSNISNQLLSSKDQLGLVINAMAAEISKLQDRIAILEKKLERSNNIDVSAAMYILGLSEEANNEK